MRIINGRCLKGCFPLKATPIFEQLPYSVPAGGSVAGGVEEEGCVAGGSVACDIVVAAEDAAVEAWVLSALPVLDLMLTLE